MKNKGFTLAELLGVIVILALIGLITMPAITNSLQTYKTRLCNTQLEEIEAAARTWAADNLYKLPTDEEPYPVSLETLSSTGYIDSDINNPVTKENFSLEYTIVYIKRTGKKYTYEVEVDPKDSCNP